MSTIGPPSDEIQIPHPRLHTMLRMIAAYHECTVSYHRSAIERVFVMDVTPIGRSARTKISEEVIEDARDLADLLTRHVVDALAAARASSFDKLDHTQMLSMLRAWLASREDGSELSEWFALELMKITDSPSR